jgi:hypothetical protein
MNNWKSMYVYEILCTCGVDIYDSVADGNKQRTRLGLNQSIKVIAINQPGIAVFEFAFPSIEK